MNDETFNNKILGQIRTEKIRPRARWFFITERWFFVVLIAVATVLGSIAVTTSIFILTDHDWSVVDHLNESVPVHAIETLPYLWLAVIVITIGVILFNIRRVGRGYRYQSWKVIALSLIASLSIGTALFLAGAGHRLDNYFDHRIPAYRALVPNNETIWQYPEDGLLSGNIQTVTPSTITLIDSDNQPWTVSLPNSNEIKANLIPGKKVKVTGTMVDGSHFTADTILPWNNSERKNE